MSKEGEQMLGATKSLEHESSGEMISLGPSTLVILDLDRTLIDSDRLADITLLSLEDNLSKNGTDDEEVERAIAAIERVREQQKQEVGNSFPYLEALQIEIGTADMAWAEELAGQVTDANRDEHKGIKQSFINQIMLPGAIELLDQIEHHQSNWLIMTAGKQATQRYKLALVQAILAEYRPDVPAVSYMITDPNHHISKAEMIRQSHRLSQDGQSRFDSAVLSKHSDFASISLEIVGQQYDKAVLLDDKSMNLQHKGDAIDAGIVTVLVKADNKPDRDGQSLADIQKRFY